MDNPDGDVWVGMLAGLVLMSLLVIGCLGLFQMLTYLTYQHVVPAVLP